MDHQSDFDYALELRDSVYFEREEKGYQEQNCPSEAREICDCITSMERGAQDTIVASLFLKLLMEGARVRRHLPYRRSEMIVLYSTDGCSTFRWMAEEDWIFGLNSQSERSMDSNSNTIRIVRSRSSDCAIKDSDILSVQTADCAVPGHFGFNIFRRSLDAHNKNLSFSIISSHESCLGGFARLVMTLLGSQSLSMLHIECDDEATFGLLVAGFELIRRGYSARCELDYNLYINGGIYLSRCQSFPYKKDDTTLKHQITIATNVTEKKAQLKSSPRVQMHEEKENDHTCRVPPRMQISARLRLAGLEVNTIALRKAHKVILITRCPEWRLEDVAEKMHLVLKLRSGQMRRFKVSRRSEYASYGPNSCLLRSAERQLIIDFLIRLKIKDGGAELDTNTELGSYISQRFPLHAHATLNQLKHCWVTFWKAGSPGDTSPGWSPVTNPLFSTANFCYSGVLSVAKAALDQPLDAIAEYYGDRIAFYFAFVAYYTRWLVVPSVLGSLVFVCQLLKNDWDHWLCIPFGLLVMVWAAFMFEYWKQESSTLAYRWGAIGRESHEIERPQFKGVYVFDRLSLEIRKKYPTWRRVLKYCVTFPIVLLCIFAILLVMLVVFVQQSEALSEFQGKTASTVDFSAIFSDRRLTSYEVETVSFTLTSENLSNIQFWVVMLLYPSFYGIVAVLAAGIFDILATLLNDWENHRTQNDYNNGLVLKIFSFRFVTIYSSLFFYAFFTPTDQEPQFRVGTAILCLLTIGQWWSKICDTCIPFTLHKIHLYFLGELGIKRVREERVVESVALQSSREPDSGLLERSRAVPYFEEALLPEYSPLGEYTNIVIQIGFILFFSIIFPLVPLLALLTNVLLLRIDAFKVCHTRQRPIAQTTSGIGVWENVLQIMSVLAIITNVVLLGIVSTHLPRVFSGSRMRFVILLIALEHTVLFFKYWLTSAVSRVPLALQRALACEDGSLDEIPSSVVAGTGYLTPAENLRGIEHCSPKISDQPHRRPECTRSGGWAPWTPVSSLSPSFKHYIQGRNGICLAASLHADVVACQRRDTSDARASWSDKNDAGHVPAEQCHIPEENWAASFRARLSSWRKNV